MSQPSALHLLLNTAETETLASNRGQQIHMERVFYLSPGRGGAISCHPPYSGWFEAPRRVNIKPMQIKNCECSMTREVRQKHSDVTVRGTDVHVLRSVRCLTAGAFYPILPKSTCAVRVRRACEKDHERITLIRIKLINTGVGR